MLIIFFVMLNFINRFIVLLFAWCLWLFNDFYHHKLNANGVLIFMLFGIVLCFLITLLWQKNNTQNQLYLSLGFYRHFWYLYWQNCLSSLKMLLKIACQANKLEPITHQIEINQNIDFALLISFHFLSGVIIDNNDNKSIKISCVDACFLEKKKIRFLLKSFQNIDDNQLI